MNKKNKIENLCNHPNCTEEGVYKAPLDYDNLDINTDLKLVKKRYKELVKVHHPDVKGDSKKVIDKFREIVEAYNYLIERYKK